MHIQSVDHEPATLEQLELQVETAIAHLACVLEHRLSPYEQTRYIKGMQGLDQCLQQIKHAREAKRFTVRPQSKAS